MSVDELYAEVFEKSYSQIKTEKVDCKLPHMFSDRMEEIKENTLYCDICEKQLKIGKGVKTHTKTLHVDVKLDIKTKPFSNYEYCGISIKEELEAVEKMFIKEENIKDSRDVTLACEDTQHKNHQQSSNEQIFEDSTTLDERRKIWQCNKCSKVFTVKSEVQQHINLHQSTNELYYNCEQCSKVFFNRSTLKEHTTVHEESYSCGICSNHFKTAIDLKTHVKTNHDFHFSCDTCDSTFLSKSDMNLHVKFNHIIVKGQPLEQKCCNKTKKNVEKFIQIKVKEKNWKTRKKRLKKYFV